MHKPAIAKLVLREPTINLDKLLPLILRHTPQSAAMVKKPEKATKPSADATPPPAD